MGIQGLLGMLKEASVPQHINQWKGKTLAVDAYVWLHRGAYGCAAELATGKTTTKYVNYAMHRVRMLKHYGVTPLIVFDGGLLPSKMGTEDDRERRRKEALAKGNGFLAEGKPSQARDCFVKAVDVTPEMAFQLIKALRREGVQYIVAPYEADPQLAYLERIGLVDGIISEDSDLLVFGCRQVLFKLDGDGNCVGIARDDFTKCREYNFAGWTEKEFRQMAILSGCDYLESIQGVGLKTAYRLLRKYKTAEKVIQFIRLEGQLRVPRSYPDDFKRAELTFLHQRVWDPLQNALVHLEPIPEGVDAGAEWPFVGAPLEPDYARQLACGEIDPISKLPMVDINPDAFLASQAYSPAPCKPLTERNTTTFFNKKAPSTSTPMPTKGTLLNFFSKASPTTSSPNPKPPTGPSSSSSKLEVQIIQPTKSMGERGPTSAAMVRDRGGFASKFFGGGAAAAKGKGKKKEVEQEQIKVEVVEVMSGSESEGEGEGAAGADVEVEVEPKPEPFITPPLDDDAVSTLREHWHDGLLSSDGEPLPPLPPLPSERMDLDLNAAEVHLSDLTDDAPPHQLAAPHSPPPRELSLAASSCGGISSPASTPPRGGIAARKASKGGKKPRMGVIADDEEGEEEGTMVEEEVRSEVRSDWGISSPVAAPVESVRKPKRERGETEALNEEDEGEEEEEELAGGGGIVSSPIASPPSRRKETAPAVVKQEKVDSASAANKDMGKKKKEHYVELSSDPIDLSSDMIIDEEESTPRARAAPRKEKSKEPTSSGSRSGKKSSAAAAVAKKRSSQVLEDEEEEDGEKEQAMESVAMAWKAKYMMNSGASKSPKLTPSTAARRSLPTPTTATTSSRGIKPTLTRQHTISRPSLSSSSKSRLAATPSASAGRLPLSPRSTNRRPQHQMLVPGSSSPPSPPLQKKRKGASSSSMQQEDRQEEDGSDDPAVVIRTSSSPVVITNPRLLAFRYGGPTAMKL